jgi:hypothetical protein
MIPDDKLKQTVHKLAPVIGAKKARALWLKYTIAKTHEKKEKLAQKIAALGESLLNLYEEKILLPPPGKEKTVGEIKLGTVTYNDKQLHDFSIRKHDLIRHIAVFGKTGSGKTNTAFHLIKGLLQENIPFIIFDWKRNFRDLLKLPEYKGKIRFYTVGREIVPFHFNPKIGPKNCDKEAYQKKLCEIIDYPRKSVQKYFSRKQNPLLTFRREIIDYPLKGVQKYN